MSALIDVLKRRIPKRRPIWFMRQAGRYLPEYRAVREKAGSFLDLCYNPALAAEVTLQPLKRFDLDAAIVFADILVVPHAMGVAVDFLENEGPVLEKVVDTERVALLRSIDSASQVDAVCDTVSRVRSSLSSDVALIGFCGAPWTVASYMVGGKGLEGREQARAVALSNPRWFAQLVDRLVEASVVYLNRQIGAGADVVQIFDSWAGDLPFYALRPLVADPIARVVAGVKVVHPETPIIVFAKGAGVSHKMIGAVTKTQALGVESSLSLDWARAELSPRHTIQGNLDPIVLEAGGAVLEEGIREILEALPACDHIFNLGHGIRRETPVDHVARAIELVRAGEAD
ncbi:uroporphyrinogen decarboxylase [soil metagenome]